MQSRIEGIDLGNQEIAVTGPAMGCMESPNQRVNSSAPFS